MIVPDRGWPVGSRRGGVVGGPDAGQQPADGPLDRLVRAEAGPELVPPRERPRREPVIGAHSMIEAEPDRLQVMTLRTRATTVCLWTSSPSLQRCNPSIDGS